MFNFGLCEDCGTEQMGECYLYICQSIEGFPVICCIVYAINEDLTILRRMDEEV